MAYTRTAAPRSGQQASLYRKLQPRPNGPAREDVVANQRARIHGAMIEATAAFGYHATSVAQLCRLAGVSKRTFYEQFKNKQHCLLASRERILAAAAERVRASRRAQGSPEQQLAGAIEVLIDEAREHPKQARLVLLEARAVAPHASWHGDGPSQALQHRIRAGLADMQPDGRFPDLLAEGVLLGIESVICDALVRNRLSDSPATAAQLARWAASYSSPQLTVLGDGVRMPALGRANPPVARARPAGERARLLRAAAEMVAAEGPDALTLARIVLRAGLEERTALCHYDTASACLADAVEQIGMEALVRALDASRQAQDGVSAVCLAIAALLQEIANDPVAHGAMLAAPSALNPGAPHGGQQVLHRMASVFLARLPEASPPSWVTSTATLGAVWGVIQHQVMRDGVDCLPAASSHLTYLALAPVIGPDAVCAALSDIAANSAAR